MIEEGAPECTYAVGVFEKYLEHRTQTIEFMGSQ